MRTVRLLGLAFVAVLAFSAIGTSSASALLFLTGLQKELFTLLSLSKVVFETNKNTIECTSILGHGFILNKTDVAEKILFTFHGCSGRELSSACQSPGEPSGLITTLDLDALLVTVLNGKYGILLLAEKANQDANIAFFACGVFNINIKGTVAGEFTETKAQSEVEKEESKVSFAKGTNAGEQAIKDVWTLEGIIADRLEMIISLIGAAEANFQAVFDVRTPFGMKLCHK